MVITGGSSGIGLATAETLARRGDSLVLAARGPGSLDDAARRCRDLGGAAFAVPTDVSDLDAVTALVDEAMRGFGHIDAWINAAGVMAFGHYEQVPVAVHRRIVETNLLGSMYGAAAVLPHFLARGAGTLVNVSSLYGLITAPGAASYAATKFGLVGFSRTLWHELRMVDGVDVSCVLPFAVDTPIWENAANFVGRRTQPLRPRLEPSRVADAIVGCLDDPRREVRVGGAGRLAVLGRRLFPWIYDRLAGPVMRALAYQDEAAPSTAGNVFEPSAALHRDR